jgi:uncharacterized membrane protein
MAVAIHKKNTHKHYRTYTLWLAVAVALVAGSGWVAVGITKKKTLEKVIYIFFFFKKRDKQLTKK